jgi:hypothetical protein
VRKKSRRRRGRGCAHNDGRGADAQKEQTAARARLRDTTMAGARMRKKSGRRRGRGCATQRWQGRGCAKRADDQESARDLGREQAPGHEIKRENKSSKDWRITPCSRRMFGFTPREAVAMIMSCEGMAADPADSTVCRSFARRRACSAAAAERTRSSGSNRGLHPLLFICEQKEYCILVLHKQQKKGRMGPTP